MARMIRKQVYIEPRHEEILKRMSRERRVTESDLIRACIDAIAEPQHQEGNPTDEFEMTRRLTRKRASLTAAVTEYPIDQQAWEEEMEFIRERARLRVAQQTRGWTRDELYDERPKYLAR